MKIVQTVVFLAVAALAIADDVPQYHKAAVDLQDGINKINNIVNGNRSVDFLFPNPKREFIQLYAFVSEVANALSRCVNSYDALYLPVLNRTVPFAWKHPNFVADSMIRFRSETLKKIKNVSELVAKYCGTDANVLNPRTSSGCDVMVDLEINNRPHLYEKEAHLLLEAGTLMTLYTNEDFIQEAYNFNMIPFMINEKKDLEELTTQLSLVLTLLREEVDPECNPLKS